jgi:hypothetical protein
MKTRTSITTLRKAFFLTSLLAITGTSLQSQDAKPGEVKLGAFVFGYGKPWVEKPSKSSMRAGELTYQFDDSQGLENVDAVFYYFGQGQGGDTEANIQRWIGQFQGAPKTETEVVEISGTKVTFLTASGTYLESAGPFAGEKTARPGYVLLGAVVESEQGNVFVKLFGPEKSVEQVKKPFRTLVRSALGKE